MDYNKLKIAIIPPYQKDDYLLNTAIDGLLELQKEYPRLEFRLPSGYPNPFPKNVIEKHMIDREAMVAYARDADLIIWSYLKKHTDFDLMERINSWHKSAIIDGSEVKKDLKYDFELQNKILNDFLGNKHVSDSLLNICPLYFKREKPYVEGITPFPFGIETRYLEHYDPKREKDIDFACIFGQEDHPRLRKYVREHLEAFCKEHGFTYRTAKTKGFDFSFERVAGRDEFYDILARAKVGISVTGASYDTVRFWETLGNNCILLTERINVYHPDGDELDFEKRFYQFNDLYDFDYQLKRVAKFLRTDYRQEDFLEEHKEILARHSSRARVMGILREAQKKGLIG